MDLVKRATATDGERSAMEITERVASVFSIIGIFFIIITYIFLPKFHRPINRLVFFASFGNLGMNIAALIAEEGPRQGADSGLCQFQGFLVQMFLGVDAYWSFCMAINVYLIFFGQFTTNQLRRLDIRYIFACYGLAFIPSIVFIFIETDMGKVYGDAVLWCWVQSKWAVLRIGLVYSVSWLAISLAVVVYVMAAINIYKRRDQLQAGFMNPLNDTPLKSIVTTEISVTVESASKVELDVLPPILPKDDRFNVNRSNFGGKSFENARPSPNRHQFTFEREMTFSAPHKGSDADNYRVAVKAPEETHANASTGLRALTRNAAEYHSNTEALLYARAAFFYFLALLIIWLPSSANRAFAVANPNVINYPLNFASCLLLSAQGFFNFIVYMVTSREAMSDLFSDWIPRRPVMHRSSSRRRGYSKSDEHGMVRHRPESRDYWV